MPGIIVAVVVGLLGTIGYSYFSSESAAKQSETWNAYNQSVEGLIPNLDSLKQTAEENAGTPTQLLANATWADGQLWMASRAYVQNRPAALEAANRARTVYESLLQSTDRSSSSSTALELGLGRVYELRNEPDKAREHYLKVTRRLRRLRQATCRNARRTKDERSLRMARHAHKPRAARPPVPAHPASAPSSPPAISTCPAADKVPTAEAAAATDRRPPQGLLARRRQRHQGPLPNRRRQSKKRCAGQITPSKLNSDNGPPTHGPSPLNPEPSFPATFTVPPEAAGRRLDRFLVAALPNCQPRHRPARDRRRPRPRRRRPCQAFAATQARQRRHRRAARRPARRPRPASHPARHPA